MRYTFILMACLFLIVMGCTTDSRKLIWSDEFDQPGSPDATNWNYELGDGCPNCGWGNNEEQIYTSDPVNVKIQGGNLIIEAIKLDSQWTSARITSRAKMNFTYGSIEFRAKLPRGAGTWPALWMLGENITTKGWPACGEIDVMEHVGRNPGVVQSALHTPSSFGETVNKGDTIVATFDSAFHIYAATWTRDKIEFFVDAKKYYTYQPEIKNDDTWPFNSPFYIIINMAVGGGFGGPIEAGLTQARMEVDYVRVYQ